MGPEQLAKQLHQSGQGALCPLVTYSDSPVILSRSTNDISPSRQQPWCTYALHIATFTSLAFVFDILIPLAMWWATEGWNHDTRVGVVTAQLVWMFGFTKWIKLFGLFKRHPADLVFLPVSIIFGWYHGFIKLYALFTLNMVSKPYETPTLEHC